MFTKEEIISVTKDYFIREGYQLEDGLADINAFKDERLQVFAFGAVSDSGHTSKIGKSFNKNQIKQNIGHCLYEIMKHSDTKSKYMIALPDNKLHEKIVKEILEGLIEHGIKLILVNEQGFIRQLA